MVLELADKAMCSIFEQTLNPQFSINNYEKSDGAAEFIMFLNQKIKEGYPEELIEEFISKGLPNRKFKKYFEKQARKDKYGQIDGQHPNYDYVFDKYIEFKGGIDGI